jgi:DNA-binding response OmpR family regulator
VVEDEALIALDIEQQLTDAGFEVVLAANGPAALNLAKTFKVQFVAAVVNLRLPEGLAGQDVIQRLRREMPDLPVVVATGFEGSAPEADLRGMGGPTVRLQKPLARTELVQCLQQVLRAQQDRSKVPAAGAGLRRRARDR